jgi:hypothetical protein
VHQRQEKLAAGWLPIDVYCAVEFLLPPPSPETGDDEADGELDDAESLESVFTTLLVSPLASPLAGAGVLAVDDLDLLSVTYQPEPLNTIPAGVITLRNLFLLHSGQRLSVSSLNDCWRSNCTPQFSQRYV